MGRKAKEANSLSRFFPVEINGWRVEGRDESYDPQSIFDYIDGAGEVYRAYNFERLVARRYRKDGEPDLIADFFDMGTASDAFGVFTHDLEGETVEIGQGAVYKGGLLSFWKDRYFVSLYAEAETATSKQALLGLGKEIDSAIPARGKKPVLLSYVPDSFDLKTIRYFHSHLILNYHFFVSVENILHLGPDTEAALASSGDKPDIVRLLIIRYPDAPSAVLALRSFAKAYMPDAGEPELVQTEDKNWTAVKNKGDYLAIIFNARSPDQARKILASVGEKIVD